jgi:hypothetical protein
MDKGFVYILASVMTVLVTVVGLQIESGTITGIDLELSTITSSE